MADDFYEEDEPVGKVRDAWERAEKGVTRRPCGVFIDGPAAGPARAILESRRGWPTATCHRYLGGDWAHYVHEVDGRYRYVGRCTDIPGHLPLSEEFDRGCCCGRPHGDRRGR